MASPIGAAIATEWLRGDTVDQVLIARKNEIERRHTLAARILDRYAPTTLPGAYHLWIALPKGWTNSSCARALSDAGIRVSTADEFAVDGAGAPHAIRLSLTSTRTTPRLERGLQTIRAELDRGPGHGALL